MADTPTIGTPLHQFEFPSIISSLLVSASSLFIGLNNGTILQWKCSPGEEKTLYTSVADGRNYLFQTGDVLWNTYAGDNTIHMWNINDGHCFQTMQCRQYIYPLIEWKGFIIASRSSEGSISVWNTDGSAAPYE